MNTIDRARDIIVVELNISLWIALKEQEIELIPFWITEIKQEKLKL